MPWCLVLRGSTWLTETFLMICFGPHRPMNPMHAAGSEASSVLAYGYMKLTLGSWYGLVLIIQ